MKPKKAIIIVGEPGIGKSTLVKRLMRELKQSHVGSKFKTEDKAPVEGYRFELQGNPTVWIYGRYEDEKAPFFGTDRLSMGVQPFAVGLSNFVRMNNDDAVVIVEGDRLGNGKFVEALHKIGFQVILVVLTASPEVVKQRRADRCAAYGLKPQADVFIRSRRTKIENVIKNSVGMGQVKTLVVDTLEDLESAYNYVSGFTAPSFKVSDGVSKALSSANP